MSYVREVILTMGHWYETRSSLHVLERKTKNNQDAYCCFSHLWLAKKTVHSQHHHQNYNKQFYIDTLAHNRSLKKKNETEMAV